jgi:hypothetical protein
MGDSEIKNILPLAISVTIAIIGSIVFFGMIGFDLDPVEETEVEKIVTVEAFESDMKNDFCEGHRGDRHRLDKNCMKLTKDNCLASHCCVFTKYSDKEEGVCRSGNEHGPTFRYDDNGKTHDIDYFYFKNKCHGKGCPK